MASGGGATPHYAIYGVSSFMTYSKYGVSSSLKTQ